MTKSHLKKKLLGDLDIQGRKTSIIIKNMIAEVLEALDGLEVAQPSSENTEQCMGEIIIYLHTRGLACGQSESSKNW